MQITRNGIDTVVGPSEWFSGSVYVDTVATPSSTSRLSASSVSRFAPNLGNSLRASTEAPHKRRVHLWQDDQELTIMPRAALSPNATLAGPVILEEAETTLVIPPGWTAELGKLGCVIARRPR